MSDGATLEARIDRLESREQIRELHVRYAILIDDHEFDALGDLFTADARFGRPGRQHSGRDAIIANYRVRGAQYPISMHDPHGAVIEFVDDDHATGQVVALSEQASEEHTVITAFRYDDEYVRADGRWRFAARSVRTLYAMTHAELAAGGLGRDLRNRWPHREPARAELPPSG